MKRVFLRWYFRNIFKYYWFNLESRILDFFFCIWRTYFDFCCLYSHPIFLILRNILFNFNFLFRSRHIDSRFSIFEKELICLKTLIHWFFFHSFLLQYTSDSCLKLNKFRIRLVLSIIRKQSTKFIIPFCFTSWTAKNLREKRSVSLGCLDWLNIFLFLYFRFLFYCFYSLFRRILLNSCNSLIFFLFFLYFLLNNIYILSLYLFWFILR